MDRSAFSSLALPRWLWVVVPIAAVLAGCPPRSAALRGIPHRVITFAPGEVSCDDQRQAAAGRARSNEVRRQLAGAKARPLFEQKAERLGRYCVVDFEAPRQLGPTGRAETSTQSAFRDGDVAAAFDQAAAIALAPSVNYPWQAVRRGFWRIAGRVEAARGVQAGPRPTIVVIDTYPDQSPFDPRTILVGGDPGTDHGFVMATLISDLVCPASRGDCFADVRTVQALRSSNPGSPRNRGVGRLGGIGGEQSELARAIRVAVDTHFAGARPGPLVLNLSLGWAPLPAFGGADRRVEDGELPPAAAVYDALRYAACRGALVVSAAGNDLGGPGGVYDDGPMYPGGWAFGGERDLGCGDFGVEPDEDGRWMLSVTGSGHESHPFALGRSESANAIAAGTHGIAVHGGRPTDLLHGTSVSTAVASAAAAAAWSVRGSNRARVVDVLMNKSPRASGSSRLSATGSSLPAVKVCEAMKNACGRDCAIDCHESPAPDVTDASLKLIPQNRRGPGRTTVRGACPTETGTVSIVGPTSPKCPSIHSVDEAPAVHTQPSVDPCIECFALLDAGIMTVVVSNDIGGYKLGTLELTHPGGAMTYYDVGAMMADQGLPNPPGASPVAIEDITVLPPDVVAAKLIWMSTTGGDTGASEIPVFED